MIVPDSNLLLHAYNKTTADHRAAREWWETCLNGGEAVGLVYPVLFSFVRIATGSRVFSTPMTLDEAEDRID